MADFACQAACLNQPPDQLQVCLASCAEENCEADCAAVPVENRQACLQGCSANSAQSCNTNCTERYRRKPVERFECNLKCTQGNALINSSLTCLQGTPGFPISNDPFCPPGMHCPNINATDETGNTFPQYCSPTPDCFQKRLFGLWCPSQGRYEPTVCEPGFFCPNASLLLPCPAEHWCTRGSFEPRPCLPATYCPPGTIIGRFYGGVLICVLLDLLLLAYFLLKIYRWDPAQHKANLSQRPRGLLLQAAPLAGPPGGAAAAAEPPGMQLPASPAPPSTSSQAVADWRSPTPSPRARLNLAGAWALARRASFSFPSLAPASSGGKGGGAQLDPLDAAVLASAKSLLNQSFQRCNGALSIRIDFSELSLTLPPPADKTILSSVSGTIYPARVTAIMGPSGAGKTTFLSTLLGTGLPRTAGTIHINGSPADLSSLGRLTGFVPQDDVMLRELTVRENIEHSARIRLPRSGWSAEEVSRHVDAVIEVLGLRHCADTATDRISGGQRKRVNIGMELALAPAAIFLDEPTSGLDSTAALQVCSTLKNIAELGVTVVAVIHQPRLDIFKAFDDLLLLAPGGRTVYTGPQKDVMPYFQGLGLLFSEGGNPADDVLDFVAGAQELQVSPGVAEQVRGFAAAAAAKPSGAAVVSNPLAAAEAAGAGAGAASPTALLQPSLSKGSLDTLAADLEGGAGGGAGAGLVTLKGKEVASYLGWAWLTKGGNSAAAAVAVAGQGWAAASQQLQHTPTAAQAASAAAAAASAAAAAVQAALPPSSSALHSDLQRTLSLRGASFARQCLLNHNRSLLQQYRQPSWLALELGVCVFAGGMMGIAATNVDELFSGILIAPFTPLSPSPNVQLLPSLGFFIAMAVGIAGSPAAVRTFGEERDMYLREVSAHHSATAYFLAKNLATLPRLSLAALHFASCFYLVALPSASYASVLVLVWGLFFGVYGLSFMVSMVVSRANGALLGTIASLVLACLCGYGPTLTQAREWSVNLGGGNFLGLITLVDMSYSRWASGEWSVCGRVRAAQRSAAQRSAAAFPPSSHTRATPHSTPPPSLPPSQRSGSTQRHCPTGTCLRWTRSFPRPLATRSTGWPRTLPTCCSLAWA